MQAWFKGSQTEYLLLKSAPLGRSEKGPIKSLQYLKGI
jgi:hypothetical protein